VNTRTVATATCRDGRVITLAVVQKQGPTRLVMGSQLHGAVPGSKWANEGGIQVPSGDGSGWGSWPNKADGNGVVRARTTWVSPPIPNRSVSTSFTNKAGGQRCEIQLGTHRLPAAG
jgi:hypothetical protein